MMRVSYFGLAAAILAATPAFAQNNATTSEANVTAANEVTANAAPAAPAGPTATTTAPGNEVAPLPESAPTVAETNSVVVQKNKTFPWGVLGLIGLIGLFGRRRSTS